MTPAAARVKLVAERPQPSIVGPLARLTLGERLLLVSLAVGVVHHLDHVFRVDHSGWPFLPAVSPFTLSLIGYPVFLLALLLRSRPWLRVGLVGVSLLATQAAHLWVETPGQQFATWANGVSSDPGARGVANLLDIASPAVGFAAAGWSILLSVVLATTTIALIREARGAQE